MYLKSHVLFPALTRPHRVPVNLVAALMMLGPVGNTSVSEEDRLVTVFETLAGLTGVATLIQVGRKSAPHNNAATEPGSSSATCREVPQLYDLPLSLVLGLFVRWRHWQRTL